jgi:carboxyl-terminal processing protease
MTKLLSFVFIALLSASTIAQTDPNKVATTQKFDEVLTYVSRMYVDTVNNDQLTDAAIIALLEKLDPHSTYISKEEVAEANSSINGSFVGIGIRFQILKDTLMVVATIPGGPSEKLGILPGDKITKIENQNVAGIGLKNAQVKERLLGELGTKVKIEIHRKSAKKPMDFVITRDNIPLNSVDAYYMLTPEIGYIKLSSFSRSSSEEIQKSIKDLKAKGMKHLVFDLQGNGGGLLDAAQKIADEFLSDDKLIVYSEGRAQPRSNLKAYKNG